LDQARSVKKFTVFINQDTTYRTVKRSFFERYNPGFNIDTIHTDLKIMPIKEPSCLPKLHCIFAFLPAVEFPAWLTRKSLTKLKKLLIFALAATLLLDKGININFADVAELADAQASGACGLWPVEVRLLSSALTCPKSQKKLFIGLKSRIPHSI
jgi:hypothetical protein